MNITETRPNKMDFSNGLIHDFEVFMWCCVVIGIAIGLILLIIGIIRKRDPKNKGKVSPVVCIILGILFLLPPIGDTILPTKWGGVSAADGGAESGLRPQ